MSPLRTMIWRALHGLSKEDILLGDAESFASGKRIAAIAHGAYRETPEVAIRGIGYVVQSQEAALWALDRTDSFEDAILMAANLGDAPPECPRVLQGLRARRASPR